MTAFDIAPTAIVECQRRFPESEVRYQIADLFTAPDEWTGRFDLVWESYTLQVLPPELRRQAIERIPRFLAPGGCLLVAARARNEDDSEGAMPWPLTRAEIHAFSNAGLSELLFEDYVDAENPPVRRFRACFQRPVH